MLLMNVQEETEEEDVEDLTRMITDVTDEDMALRLGPLQCITSSIKGNAFIVIKYKWVYFDFS